MLATTVNLPARVAPSPQILIRADVGIHHIGAPEEFGFGCARHQTGHGHIGFLQLFLQRVGEGIEKGFGAVVDRRRPFFGRFTTVDRRGLVPLPMTDVRWACRGCGGH